MQDEGDQPRPPLRLSSPRPTWPPCTHPGEDGRQLVEEPLRAGLVGPAPLLPGLVRFRDASFLVLGEAVLGSSGSSQ